MVYRMDFSLAGCTLVVSTVTLETCLGFGQWESILICLHIYLYICKAVLEKFEVEPQCVLFLCTFLYTESRKAYKS